MFSHIHVDISVGFGTKQECKRNKPRDEKGMATFRRLTVSLVEAALDIGLKIQSWKDWNVLEIFKSNLLAKYRTGQRVASHDDPKSS